jgi:hypothetical protein
LRGGDEHRERAIGLSSGEKVSRLILCPIADDLLRDGEAPQQQECDANSCDLYLYL